MGGLDYSGPYNYLECTDNDVIVDVGCGMGDALNYLKRFKEYHGFDTDQRAISAFDKKSKNNVFAYSKPLMEVDIERIKPNKAMLLGLLHHVTDEEGMDILKALSKRVTCIGTLDAVYVKGRPYSNMLAFLDRGRNVKTKKEYDDFIAKSPYYIFRSDYYIPSKNGWGYCYIMDLRLK